MTIAVAASEQAYFQSLWQRRAEARNIVRREVTFADGSAPLANACHANAERWVAENPDFEVVRGWLIESDDGHFIRLAAHALVRNSKTLIEITPLGAAQPPFLEHLGADSAFLRLLPRFNSVTWPPPTPLDASWAPEQDQLNHGGQI